MPTNKPRIFVTLDSDLYSDLLTYMSLSGFTSKSAAVSWIVQRWLFEFFQDQSYGVTLFDKYLNPLSINGFDS